MPKLMVIRIMMGAVLLSTAPISQTFAQVDQQDQEPHAGETSKPNVILLKAEPMPVASGDWPVWASVVGGSKWGTTQKQMSSPGMNALVYGAIGAAIGGGVGFVVGGIMNGAASGAFTLEGGPDLQHPCFDKNCALTGLAIGAGIGFVAGAIIGAVTTPEEKSSEQHRANLIIMPLHDGSLGVGLSVAF